jgi:multiple antibiotic resistance protein
MEVGFMAAVVKALVPLLIIVSPHGAAPLFLSMTVADGATRRRRSALYAAATCSVVLGLAALFGEVVFQFFGITIDAFRIAGGALMFLYAIDMVQMRTPRMKTTQEEVDVGVSQQEVGIIPLGVPMLAGPGAIATVMALRIGGHDGGLAVQLAAIGLLGVASAAILLAAVRVERWMSPVVMGMLVRLQGLLLGAIAVQMLVSGIRGAFGIVVAGAASV